jgi:hypothetical protein
MLGSSGKLIAGLVAFGVVAGVGAGYYVVKSSEKSTQVVAPITPGAAQNGAQGGAQNGAQGGDQAGGAASGQSSAPQAPKAAENVLYPVGSCFDKFPEKLNTPTVDCSKPHILEVIFAFTSYGVKFNKDAITEEAKSSCSPALQSYVASISPDSKINLTFLFPSEEGWEKNERVVTCLARMGDKPTTGSIKGKAV